MLYIIDMWGLILPTHVEIGDVAYLGGVGNVYLLN